MGVDFATPVIDGVEQPQEGRRCKPFVYSGKTLLIMMYFEKKVQKRNRTSEGAEGGGTHQGGLKLLSVHRMNYN